MRSYIASSMRDAARCVIEGYPMGHVFTMKEFEYDVIRQYPRAKFNLSHTIDRRLREFRYGENYDINCIDKVKAVYRKDKIDLKKRAALKREAAIREKMKRALKRLAA
jgi:hypothetical protein